MYWTLPDGRCVCWTAREMANAREDQLADKDSAAAYDEVGKQMGYIALGQLPEDDLEAYRANTGTLAERSWKHYTWARPGSELCACWWVVNADDPDKGQLVKMSCVSLACLRLELHDSRIASSAKLRTAWVRRKDENKKAAGVLIQHESLWRSLGGPDLASLL